MILENVDQYVLIECIDPDWRDHFIDTEHALDFYLSGISPRELSLLIRESGARNDQ